MKKQEYLWLASYPRSGNTMLRTVIYNCFGLKTASIYSMDLDGNKALEEYVGHIEHGTDGNYLFPPNSLPMVKTHGRPIDTGPAIYVVRDGRNVCVSMWLFYNKEISLEKIITGKTIFGTWSAHLQVWRPWDRPYTLLLN